MQNINPSGERLGAMRNAKSKYVSCLAAITRKHLREEALKA